MDIFPQLLLVLITFTVSAWFIHCYRPTTKSRLEKLCIDQNVKMVIWAAVSFNRALTEFKLVGGWLADIIWDFAFKATYKLSCLLGGGCWGCIQTLLKTEVSSSTFCLFLLVKKIYKKDTRAAHQWVIMTQKTVHIAVKIEINPSLLLPTPTIQKSNDAIIGI